MQDFKRENLIGVQLLVAFRLLANYQVDMSEFCRKLQGRPQRAIHYFRSIDFLSAATSDDTNTFQRVVIKVATPKGDTFTIGCGVTSNLQ